VGYDGSGSVDGGVFAVDFLRAVVWVECPCVLSCEDLGGVLTHDLRPGYGLSLGHRVSVPDVEDQAGRLAHGLDAYEVIGDEAGE